MSSEFTLLSRDGERDLTTEKPFVVHERVNGRLHVKVIPKPISNFIFTSVMICGKKLIKLILAFVGGANV